MLVMKFLLKATYEKYADFLNSQEAKKFTLQKPNLQPYWFIYNLRLQKVKTSIAKNVVLAVT